MADNNLSPRARQAQIAASFQQLAARYTPYFNQTAASLQPLQLPSDLADKNAQNAPQQTTQPAAFPLFLPTDMFFTNPHPVPDFCCRTCFASFPSQQQLVHHIAQVHSSDTPPNVNKLQTEQSHYPIPNPYIHPYFHPSAFPTPPQPPPSLPAPPSNETGTPQNTSTATPVPAQKLAQPQSTPSDNHPSPSSSSTRANKNNSHCQNDTNNVSSDNATSEFSCFLCKVNCGSRDQLESHLNGSKHRRRAESNSKLTQLIQSIKNHGIVQLSTSTWKCNHCLVTFDNQNEVVQHFDSSKHKRALANPRLQNQDQNQVSQPALQPHASPPQPILHQSSTGPNIASSSSNQTQPPSTPTPAVKPTIVKNRTACQNAVHSPAVVASAVAAAASSGNFSCDICGVTCNSLNSFTAHMASAKHIRRSNGGAASTNFTKSTLANGAAPPSQPLPKKISCIPPPNLVAGNEPASRLGSVITPYAPPGISPQSSSSGASPAGGQSSAPVISSNSAIVRPDITFYCDICDVDVCGRNNFELHIKGKNHGRRLRLRHQQDVPQQQPNRLDGKKEALKDLSPAIPSVTSSCALQAPIAEVGATSETNKPATIENLSIANLMSNGSNEGTANGKNGSRSTHPSTAAIDENETVQH